MPRHMSTGNAFGFFFFGLLMWFLPTLAPGLFAHQALDGASTRALWVQVMAVVQTSLGLGFLIRQDLLPRFSRWLSRAPAPQPVWQKRPVPAGAVPVALNPAPAVGSFLKEGALIAGRRLQSNRMVTFRGKHAPLWRALKVAFLDQKRFVYFLERLRLLAHGHRDGAHAHGATPVIFSHDAQHAL